MKTSHALHVYRSPSLLSVQRVVVSPELRREGVRAPWTGPPRRRGGSVRDGTQHFSREAEVFVLKTTMLEKARFTNKRSGGLVGLQVRRRVGPESRLPPVPSRTCCTRCGAEGEQPEEAGQEGGRTPLVFPLSTGWLSPQQNDKISATEQRVAMKNCLQLYSNKKLG